MCPKLPHCPKLPYVAGTSSVLECIENVNNEMDNQNWNLDGPILFSIYVQAFYPSVKLEHLKKALAESFEK